MISRSFIWIVLICYVDFSTCNQFVPVIPRECEGLSFCDQVPNYPHEHVSRIITELENKGQISHSDDALDTNFDDKPGNAINICSFRTATIFPLAAQDEDGEWYFVLNRLNKPVQTVKVEMCKNRDEECGKGVGSIKIIINPAYRSICNQEYVNLELFGLDIRMGK